MENEYSNEVPHLVEISFLDNEKITCFIEDEVVYLSSSEVAIVLNIDEDELVDYILKNNGVSRFLDEPTTNSMICVGAIVSYISYHIGAEYASGNPYSLVGLAS